MPAKYPEDFERFWKLYPARRGKKVGKGAAYSKWKSLGEESRAEIVRATVNYSRSDLARSGYARDPQRFLQARYWEDWLEDPGEVDERSWLLERLQGHAGKKYKVGTLITTGIAYMHADVAWHELPTKKLREILATVEKA